MKIIIWILFFATSTVYAGWSVSTFNVRNFEKPSKAHEAALIAARSDVMAFEEIVDVQAFKTLISGLFPNHGVRISDCGGRGQQHLALVFNQKIFKFNSQTEDLSFSGGTGCGSLRPVLLISLHHKTEETDYLFGVVHLKAGGDERAMKTRAQQYKKLGDLAQSLKAQNVIFLGDFNTTGFNIENQDFTRFSQFLSRSRLVTTSHEVGCTNYWGEENQLQASILDHIVIPENLSGYVEGVKVGSHCAKQKCQPASAQELGPSFLMVSDHCPVQVTFN